MDLTFVVDRIRSQNLGFKQLGGSADLDAAMAGSVIPPAAFVIPLREKAEPSETTMVTRQRITAGFGVVMAVMNRRDAQGAASLVELNAYRSPLRSALVGWVHDVESGEPIQFDGGNLLRLDGDGRLWWIDEFFYMSTFRSN